MKSQYFASCPRGLEAILSDELTALGAVEIKVVDGGVKFESSTEVMYRANLTSRIATRILCRVANGDYKTEDDLYNAALNVKWANLFDVSHGIKVSTTGVKCPLKSLDFMTLRIKDAFVISFEVKLMLGQMLRLEIQIFRIHFYLEANYFDLYIDSSGHLFIKEVLENLVLKPQ